MTTGEVKGAVRDRLELVAGAAVPGDGAVSSVSEVSMAQWSVFYLSIILAVLFAVIGAFYLVPGWYHPFSTDTIGITHAHLKHAALFLALAIGAVVAGRFAR
ncbi:MAG TPA: hypothetical protein VIC85_17740, partial [Ktedonobacterales bacterium]